MTRYPDYGSNFEELANTQQAYTPFKGLFSACLVMIDGSTLFMIGGRTGGKLVIEFNCKFVILKVPL